MARLFFNFIKGTGILLGALIGFAAIKLLFFVAFGLFTALIAWIILTFIK